jgi:predicted restriction endonuclease
MVMNELTTHEQDAELSKLQEEIETGFKNLQSYRSEFLMRNSVLAMPATIDGQYWQCMLERNVHFWELVRLKYDYKEKICGIELKEAKLAKKEDEISRCADKFDKAILQAEANKLKVQVEKDNAFLAHMKKDAEQRIREITTWTKLIEEIKPKMKYSLTDPEEHQPEEYANQYAKKIEIIKQMGSTDMNGTINTFLVGTKIFKDKSVLKLIEDEQKQLAERV